MTDAQRAEAARRLANAVARADHDAYAKLSYAIKGLPPEDKRAIEAIYGGMQGPRGPWTGRPGA